MYQSPHCSNLADRGIGLDDLLRQPDRQHRDIHIGIDNDGFPLVPGQGFGQNTAEHGFAAAGASPDGDNLPITKILLP